MLNNSHNLNTDLRICGITIEDLQNWTSDPHLEEQKKKNIIKQYKSFSVSFDFDIKKVNIKATYERIFLNLKWKHSCSFLVYHDIKNFIDWLLIDKQIVTSKFKGLKNNDFLQLENSFENSQFVFQEFINVPNYVSIIFKNSINLKNILSELPNFDYYQFKELFFGERYFKKNLTEMYRIFKKNIKPTPSHIFPKPLSSKFSVPYFWSLKNNFSYSIKPKFNSIVNKISNINKR